MEEKRMKSVWGFRGGLLVLGVRAPVLEESGPAPGAVDVPSVAGRGASVLAGVFVESTGAGVEDVSGVVTAALSGLLSFLLSFLFLALSPAMPLTLGTGLSLPSDGTAT